MIIFNQNNVEFLAIIFKLFIQAKSPRLNLIWKKISINKLSLLLRIIIQCPPGEKDQEISRIVAW